VETGTGPEFDAVKGVRPFDGTNGGHIEFEDIVTTDILQRGGQMSFEVEKDALAGLKSGFDVGRVAANPGVDVHFWSSSSDNSSVSSAVAQIMSQLTANLSITIPTTMARGIKSVGQISVHGYSDDFVRVNLSWVGSQTTMAIDGQIVMISSVRTWVSDSWKYFFIGSMKNRSGVWGQLRNFTRNWQISTRPAMFPVRPIYRVAFAGDSFTTGAETRESFSPATNNLFQTRGGDAFRGYFRSRGYDIDTHWYGVGGDALADTAALTASITEYAPNVVVLQCSVNDAVADTDPDTYDTAIRSLIADYIAAGVSQVIVNTITTLQGDSSQAAHEVSVDALNVKIRALTDVATVVDDYTSMAYGNNYFIGEINGSTNNLHPGEGGNNVWGLNRAMALQL